MAITAMNLNVDSAKFSLLACTIMVAVAAGAISVMLTDARIREAFEVAHTIIQIDNGVRIFMCISSFQLG